jgi:hypothetical protein
MGVQARINEMPLGRDAEVTSKSVSNPTLDDLYVRILGIHQVFILVARRVCPSLFSLFSE